MKGLMILPSRNGRGVFTTVPISKDYIVWDWSDCKRFWPDQIPKPYTKDHYLQVAPNLYIGPDTENYVPDDGGDFINHSCEPNCFIFVRLPSILLVALRDIAVDEEITYDYAATMYDDQWEMKCNCGTPKCRGIVREVIR